MQVRLLILISMMGILTLGCLKESLGSGGASDQKISVKSVLSGFQSQSMASDASAMWIESEEQMEKIQRLLFGGQMGGGNKALPPVDFSNYGLMLIHMGRKPTAGYAIELLSETASVRKGVATLTLKWTQPGKDMFTAQVITSPYLLLKIEKNGYGIVKVEDETGKVRLKLSVSSP